MKQELEDEYLVTFKKMVAQYNVFQQRLASRPTLKTDRNFHVFLTSEKIFDLRCKNAKEKLTGFFNSFQKSSDELLLSNTQNDVDDFFESEKAYLLEYGDRLTSWMEPLLELESEGEAAAERQRLNSLAVPGSAPSRAATKLNPGAPSRAAISSHLAGTMPPGLRGPERRAWLEERADSSVPLSATLSGGTIWRVAWASTARTPSGLSGGLPSTLLCRGRWCWRAPPCRPVRPGWPSCGTR